MPKRTDISKILVLGSGPIVIGQSAEFDYSGTQACKALKAEGFEVVLANSNPATIMTDPESADRTYIEPLTLEYLEEIIRIEDADQRGTRDLDGMIARCRRTAILLEFANHQSAAAVIGLAGRCSGTVGRTVVNDDDFGHLGLSKRRRDGQANSVAGILCRDDYTDAFSGTVSHISLHGSAEDLGHGCDPTTIRSPKDI